MSTPFACNRQYFRLHLSPREDEASGISRLAKPDHFTSLCARDYSSVLYVVESEGSIGGLYIRYMTVSKESNVRRENIY